MFSWTMLTSWMSSWMTVLPWTRTLCCRLSPWVPVTWTIHQTCYECERSVLYECFLVSEHCKSVLMNFRLWCWLSSKDIEHRMPADNAYSSKCNGERNLPRFDFEIWRTTALLLWEENFYLKCNSYINTMQWASTTDVM